MRVLGVSHKNQGTIVHCARDYVNNELTIYNVRSVIFKFERWQLNFDSRDQDFECRYGDT